MEKALYTLKEYQFFFLCFSFLVGVFVSSLSTISLSWGFFIFLLCFISFLYSFFIPESDFRISLRVASLCLLFLASGVVYFTYRSYIPENSALEDLVGQKITIESVIREEPQNKGNFEQYIVGVEGSKDKILVKGQSYPKFEYGDRVKFTGKLQKATNFETQNGKEFDYVSYLRKDNITYILSFANGSLVSKHNGNFIVSSLYAIKRGFVRNIEQLIPEPASSLLSGVLLGIQDTMGKDLEDVFRRTGIIHIVVLSGYNISIVADSLISLFSFVSRKVALSISSVGIILFSLMVGATPSVLRASVMALLVLVAKATGRTYAVGRALLVACILMVLWNPSVLVFDTSFQLSFLSTIAIIWISPIVKRYLKKVPEKFGLRETMSATLATQIFVLPLLLYKMGQVSLVSLPVNVLVLGFIPPIMLFGFIAGLLEFILHIVAFPFASASYILLTYVIIVAKFFSGLPFASVQISYFPAIFFWLSYILFGFLYYKFNKKQEVNPV